jgi:GntR family transcriptional regulator
LNIDLNPTSPTPLYLQIVDQVKRALVTGALLPGEQLPTVRELSILARVNRNTVARAFQILESEGLVRARVGQGTFVLESAPRRISSARGALLDEELDRIIRQAESLGEPLGDLVRRLNRRIRVRRVRGRVGHMGTAGGSGDAG